jgi:hypothetical protein
MPSLVLHYFDFPGRAEAVRQIFAVGGVDYTVSRPA